MIDVTRKAEATATPEVVDRARFQRELDKLRSREKAHTRAGDAIAAEPAYLHSRDITFAVLCQRPYGKSHLPRLHGLGHAVVLRATLP